jgi:hypothetical protein
MAAIVWVSMGTALWHFTIFMPDRFPGGIVGAFVWANMGALVVGLVSGGFSRPSLAEVGLADAIEGLVGGMAGLALAYAVDARSRRAERRRIGSGDAAR